MCVPNTRFLASSSLNFPQLLLPSSNNTAKGRVIWVLISTTAAGPAPSNTLHHIWAVRSLPYSRFHSGVHFPSTPSLCCSPQSSRTRALSANYSPLRFETPQAGTAVNYLYTADTVCNTYILLSVRQTDPYLTYSTFLPISYQSAVLAGPLTGLYSWLFWLP